MLRRAFSFALLTSVLTGCIASRTSTDKLLDAAHEHNGAIRFGRMDVALEHVASASRQDWLLRRTEWKNGVRFVDVELDGMQLGSMEEASIHVRLSWQRVDDSELRTTDLVQKWQSKSGPWQLVSEECTGGDPSLLAELKPSKQ